MNKHLKHIKLKTADKCEPMPFYVWLYKQTDEIKTLLVT